jgi:integrase/recombinase XerD
MTMIDFNNYLVDSGFSESTIQQHIKSIEYFLNWSTKQDKEIHNFTYREMVLFIDETMRSMYYKNGLSKAINRKMTAISHYFDFLIINNPGLVNPAKNIRIRNPHRMMVHDLLSEKEIINMYESIEPNDARCIRNKVMLGLLIFQGLSNRELHSLTLKSLKLRKGTILVLGVNIGNWRKGSGTRELYMEALQIIDLIDYIDNVRPRILTNSFRQLPGRKPTESNCVYRTDQLLLSLFGSPCLKNSLHHMFNNLKKKNPRIKSAMQIRQSVIALWLKKYNLRKVQYMAGHRFVSSTEYYKQININDLRREVCEHHPLG